MSKDTYEFFKRNAKTIRNSIEFSYTNKYYNLFVNSFSLEGLEDDDMSYQAEYYFKRKLWSEGTIAEWKNNVNQIIFAGWAGSKVNLYGFTQRITLINEYGSKAIPSKIQNVDENVVIIYAQRNRKSIKGIVDYYVQKIVDLEMTYRNQLLAHSVPFLLATTPENEKKISKLWNNILMGESALFLSADEMQSLNIFSSGQVYILDKIRNEIDKLDNDVLSILGIDNNGSIEKKEHLVVDEINANNQYINDNSSCIFDSIEEGLERGNKLFNRNIKLIRKSVPVVESTDDTEGGNEDDQSNESK